MSLDLEFITTWEQLEVLKDEWNPLLASSHTNEVFLTWQWQTIWWQAYKPGDLFVFAARDESGALVGLAPWFREAGSFVIRPIGCVEVTDYLDIIAIPELSGAFLDLVARRLKEMRQDFVRLNMCNTPSGSPTLQALPQVFEPQGWAVTIQQQEVCPIIQLPESFDAYLAGLDKKQRHELRRKLRRAEEGDAKVGWYIVRPEHDLEAEIERFITLMAASQAQKAGFLSDPQNTAFFRAIVPQMAVCGWLQMAFLTVDEVPAAAYLNFVYDNRVLVYNSGLDSQRFSAYSPGIVLLLYLIQHAIENRRAVFDFLRGDEEYKLRMGGQQRPVMEIQARLVDAPQN